MRKPFLFVALTWLFFTACKKESCLGEAGSVVTVTRATSTFHQIDVYDNIDVILIQDSIEKIELVAPQHLEPNIITQIENGVLRIKNEASCTWLRRASEKATAYVHLKKLDRIDYAGSGAVSSSNTLLADNLTIYSERGAGNIELTVKAVQTFSYIMDENADIILHGSSDVCYSYTGSRGTIGFSDFTVKKMVIEYGGVRDATIHVTEDLNAILYYKGNVYYKGLPVITKNEVHSSGQLIHIP